MIRKKASSWKWVKIGFCLFAASLLLLVLQGKRIRAAAHPQMDKEGNIIFETTDTIATSGTRWSEVGFTIRRDKSNGNPIKDNKYAVLHLKDSYRTKKDQGNGTYLVSFKIPKKDVSKALEKAGLNGIGDEDVIYLNGIFSVIRNGVRDKSYYRTLSSIKGAASWRNPNDFKELFDVKMPFEPDEYPVYVEYRTNSNTVLSTKKLKEVKEGKKVTVKLEGEVINNSVKFELYRSFVIPLKSPGKKVDDYKISQGNTMKEIQNREAKVTSGGIKIVAMMKPPKNEIETDTEEEVIREELPDQVESFCVIDADDRGSEAFDVQEGIPGLENLYVNGFSQEYLKEYEFRKVSGKKTYPVTVKRTYHLTWTESYSVTDKETGQVTVHSVNRSTSSTVSNVINVERDYSFWKIEKLAGYIPSRMLIQNSVLPGSLLYLEAKNTVVPEVSLKQWGDTKFHISEPVYSKTLVLSPVTVSGGSSCPSVPSENFAPYAQAHVSQINVRNDALTWNGKVIMEDGYKTKNTEKPKKIPDSTKMTGKDVFYKNRLLIDGKKKNDTYISDGKVTYKAFVKTEDGEKKQDYEIEEINEVVVHTPTVCNGSVEDKAKDCQMLFPDMDRCALVLGLSFRIRMPTDGQHRRIKGYGYNEYGKYIKSRQVKFPFDVEKEGERIGADTWIEVTEEEVFYLPTDVKEGKYEINFRSVAINGQYSDPAEEYANEDYENYAAVNQIPVEVSGRLYDFKIYDISDYPLWKQVFRKQDSLEKTGFNYPVREFPLKPGKHPLFPNLGALKPGYVLRMNLTTSGNMEGEGDYIRILPKFYYVDSNYKNRREVDVYYSETIGGTFCPFVQVGSQIDAGNIKMLHLGETYLSVEPEEISYTVKNKGGNEKEFLKTKCKAYRYDKIMLPAKVQVLFPPKGMQKWYFEYSLPSKIYVTDKGTPVKEYCKENTLNLKEDFWLKDGYLLLNFDIETIEENKRHLSYINEVMEGAGYCNMWKKEGFSYEYGFKNGDVGIFSLKESAAVDYDSRGTH